MKSCPTCKRFYEDDTLAFCLDDGARLSAPYEPRLTLRGPAGRDTEPPKTEILPPELAPAPWRSTISAVTPSAYSQKERQSQQLEKGVGKHWIVLSAMLAFVVVGLVIALGYLAWKANNKSIAGANNESIPEPSRVSSSGPTNSNAPVNANKDSESKLSDNTNESKLEDDTSFRWLDGVWEGEGYQTDTATTWATKLTVQDGSYAIEYPDIPCRGSWTLIYRNTTEARFIESITQGTGRCANNSHVTVQKVNDSEVSCTFTHSGSRVVATVVLSRKPQSAEKK